MTALAEDVATPDNCLFQPRLKNSDTLANLESLVKHLPDHQRAELVSLISEFSVLFSDAYFWP